ncbi:MAG TPA: DUF4097 family beta strand repeat-containing protein [Spirochaetia bacterium]|nr:DUF4097 family beta strand repeat-containing protein [Spirochaetia bacterium]
MALRGYRLGGWRASGVAVALACALVAPALLQADGSAAGAEHTFPGAYEVDIDGGGLNLHITGTNSTSVKVVEASLPQGTTVAYSDAGGKVSISVSGGTGTPVAAAGAPPSKGTLEITMPRYEFLHAVTTSGDIVIDNLSTEKLSLQSGSGAITAKNSNAALVASSDSGPQTFDAVYGAITSTSTSGTIEVDGGIGVLHLTSHHGAIKGSGFILQAPSTFETEDGQIAISFGNGLAGLAFRLKSTTGALDVGTLHGSGSLSWGSSGVVITGTSTSGSQRYD